MALPRPQFPLFNATELAAFLGGTTTEERADVAERVAWGWLKPVLSLTERPNPVPDEVFSWGLELGAIAHENPSGLSSKQLGPGSQQFSAERRREILSSASAAGSASGVPAPRGSFPAAQAYPDPIRGWP